MDLDDLWDEDPKSKAGGKSVAKKSAPKDDDGWGDLGLDDPPMTVASKTPANKQPFGFGGPTGLRKEKVDDDEWETNLEPSNKSIGGGRLLGRKSNPKTNDDDDDDFLDGMLDAIEEKRGLESTKREIEEPKAPPPVRPKTAGIRNSSWGGGGGGDDLDDLDNPNETASQRGANEALAAKRRALFGISKEGGGPSAQKEGGARASTAPRPATAQNRQPSFGLGTAGGGSADQADFPNLNEANASMGSHGSGIEVLDVPSRSRRMIRPPTASGKPPNPPANLNQIQQLHQNNVLTRPETGSKKPSGGPSGQNASGGPTDDGDILNLLDESQNAASNAGSLGARPTSTKQEIFQNTASNVDFERAEEDEVSEYEYYEESPPPSEKADPDDSDEDAGSYYQPTLIAKVAKPKVMKKKKKVKKPKKVTIDYSKNLPPHGGGLSHMGSGAGYDFNDSVKKGNTIGSEGDQGFVMQNPPPRGQTAKFPNTEQSPIKQRPTDPKEQLKFDIEEERIKIQKMEEQYRNDLDKVRIQNQQTISDIEKQFLNAKKQQEEEKQKILEDKNTAIEQDKKKLSQLNKIDIENREMQYTKSLQNQRQLFEDQQQNLRKQLQERVQINDLAQQISQSSGNINSLVAKIGAANEGNLQRREDDISRREKEVDEKRRQIAERKLAIEQRKRKLQQEIEEIKSRENETKLDYQREKTEITADLDKIEMDHLKDVRLIRDKVIECEVETRKVRQDVEKVNQQIEKEEVKHNDRLDDFTIEKRQIQQGQENFKVDSDAQERQLRKKLVDAQNTMKEVIKQGVEIDRKQNLFDDEHNRIIADNDALQEELDKYCIEKELFDRNAQQIKEKGEIDQIDSEKIGYFKANKARLNEELKQLRIDLEAEKIQIREDKIELEIFKNELKTKSKTIESMRYNYIKGDQQTLVQRAEFIANAKGPALPPRTTEQSVSYPTINFNRNSTEEAPRFNYDNFMKGLSDKISGAAPNANAHIGADFQAYLLREREGFMKSVHEFEKDTPLIQSLAKLRTSNREVSPDLMKSNGPSSLHYMSRGGLSDY